MGCTPCCDFCVHAPKHPDDEGQSFCLKKHMMVDWGGGCEEHYICRHCGNTEIERVTKMKNHTIDEFRVDKSELQTKISVLLSAFAREYGIKTIEIDATNSYSLGEGLYCIVDIDAEF